MSVSAQQQQRRAMLKRSAELIAAGKVCLDSAAEVLYHEGLPRNGDIDLATGLTDMIAQLDTIHRELTEKRNP